MSIRILYSRFNGISVWSTLMFKKTKPVIVINTSINIVKRLFLDITANYFQLTRKIYIKDDPVYIIEVRVKYPYKDFLYLLYIHEVERLLSNHFGHVLRIRFIRFLDYYLFFFSQDLLLIGFQLKTDRRFNILPAENSPSMVSLAASKASARSSLCARKRSRLTQWSNWDACCIRLPRD